MRKKRKMKIGFFGTPDLASCCLRGLVEGHEVLFVVAPPDKPSGRNRRLVFCPAKDEAMCNDIPVYQPDVLTEASFMETIKAHGADIFVVVAYGKIIPADVFNMPPLGTVNLHPSLLPLYRGAAPVQWALINGEKKTGITVQLINERMDAGDIILQEKIELDDEIDAGELFEIVKEIGGAMLSRAVELLASGAAVRIVQDERSATYCGKITKETAQINWAVDSKTIHNLVRGLNPSPCAHTRLGGKVFKIRKTSLRDIPDVRLRPGELSFYGKKRVLAGTGSGVIEIVDIQPETKKPMSAGAFINGHGHLNGSFFQ